MVFHNSIELYMAEFETHELAWKHYLDVRSVDGLKWAECIGIHREDGVVRLGFYAPWLPLIRCKL